MAYFLNLFSPETFQAFMQSRRDVSGFRARQRAAAGRISPGSKLLCYLTGLSRWCGLLEVLDGPFEETTPLFVPEDDPFLVRFHVRATVLLDPERAIPIHEPSVWRKLSFTRDHNASSTTWTGKVRSSLAPIEDADGRLLKGLLLRQRDNSVTYPLDENDRRRLATHTVQRIDRTVSVTVPDEPDARSSDGVLQEPEMRESAKIQTTLARIGMEMGMRIWIPRADRGLVLQESPALSGALLERLPLNYDDTTLRTIENIDVLWLKGRSIVRAFEVEYTTSIYSGILRMADLFALQPNMDIRLHIVAPPGKREKVLQEIRRPVFLLLERKPLAEVCSYILTIRSTSWRKSDTFRTWQTPFLTRMRKMRSEPDGRKSSSVYRRRALVPVVGAAVGRSWSDTRSAAPLRNREPSSCRLRSEFLPQNEIW